MNEMYKARLGLMPMLAERGTSGHIGRTALMKYMYFLQTIRDLRLGYDFSMYSYGPFDSNVLADLSSAESMGVVQVTPVEFPGGYGYRISPGIRASAAKNDAKGFLMEHEEDIAWLFTVFGSFNSAELELASTIVYVDRELMEGNQHQPVAGVVNRVYEIKPRFTQPQIRKFVETLLAQQVLVSTTA